MLIDTLAYNYAMLDLAKDKFMAIKLPRSCKEFDKYLQVANKLLDWYIHLETIIAEKEKEKETRRIVPMTVDNK